MSVKTDNNPTTAKINRNKSSINLKSEKPTNTLLVSDLTKSSTESDIKSVFNSHGIVDRILVINDNCQALVEFSNASIPSNIVYNSKISPVKLGTHALRLSFSGQSIDEYRSLSAPNTGRQVTKVLHFLITNAIYSITVDVLHKICSPYGRVVRVYIGKKNELDNSIEALIEFATDNDARHAKDNLDGNDIYSGCCSLSLSYSKIHRIHVDKNDSESCDFSVVPKTGLLGPSPCLESSSSAVCRYPATYAVPFPIPPPLFSPPPPPPPSLYSLPYPIPPPPFAYQSHGSIIQMNDKKKSNTANNSSTVHYKLDPTTQEIVEGVVLFVSNLSSKMKPDNLFNIFCLYGNVEKIKMGAETGPRAAFVQMANREAAEIGAGAVNHVVMFGKSVRVEVDRSIKELTDCQPNTDPVQQFFSDFYNRFRPGSKPSKIYLPSQTLHFFNVPSTFRAEDIADVFVTGRVKGPSQVVMFPPRKAGGGGGRSGGPGSGTLVTGLIEFDSVHEAVEGIVMVNHTRLLLPQVSHPFHIKLSFSPARISEQHILRSTGETQSDTGTVAGDRPLKRHSNDDKSDAVDNKSSR